ncbi:MAG: cell surface protein SprA, partial [Candidatus Latescibacterota bacterium]
NLNTKGKGYIDDFEGSERPVSLSVGRTKWTPSGPPAGASQDPDDRRRMIWYNPYESIRRTEIWPGEEEQLDVAQNKTDVLVLELTPDAASQSWGAVMTAFSSINDFSQSKFIEVWARGQEGVLQIDLGSISEDVDGDGRLDTEDEFYPGQRVGDGLVSREEDLGIDRRSDADEVRHYLALAGLDTAGLAEEEAQVLFREHVPDRSPADPEGDNWHFKADRPYDYSRINGTQGNKEDYESGDRADTEDLNDDGVLNTRDDYCHYEIDLATAPHVPDTESNGWRLFRIPLFGEGAQRAGAPDSTRVEYARLILSSPPRGGEEPVRAEVALIEVVGNEWQQDEVVVLDGIFPAGEDEGLNVTSVGTDKSLTYDPPPGVKVRRNPQSRTREREQSLVLAYDDLEPGHQVSATKVLSQVSNYTKYRRLQMYVHGDTSGTGYARGDSSDLDLFVRFGADSTNYYEFVSPVFPGWDNGRRGWQGNQVDIDLLAISQLKAVLQSGRTDLLDGPLAYVVLDPRGASVDPLARLNPQELQQVQAQGFDPVVALELVVADPHRRDGEPAIYRVRGNPSMQQIKQLSIGLRSRAGSQRYSGRVFADELRLDEARNDAGVAAFARLNAQLADFANLDTDVEWRQDDFRTPMGTGGSSTDLEAGVQTSVQLHQFLPGSWGLSIPAKVQLRQGVSLPRFGPNSDVELTAVEKDSLRSDYAKEYYDITVSRRQGKRLLLKWTLDQMNLRLSHSVENRSTPVRPLDDSQAQTMSFSYRMPLPRPGLGLFAWMPGFVPEVVRKMELRYLPSGVSYSMSADRRQRASFQAADVRRTTGRADTTFQEDFRLNETYSVKLAPFGGITGDYDLRVERDLRKRFDPQALSFGREVGRVQQADVNLNLRFLRWLDQNYTFKATYDEDSDPTSRRVQAIVDTTTGRSLRTLDVDSRNDLSARYSLKVPQVLKAIGAPGRAGQSTRKPPRRDADEEEVAPQAGEGPPPARPPEAEAPDQPFFLRRLLHFTGEYIEPLNATWRRNTDARSFNLVERPPLAYQLGLDDSLRVARAGRGLTQQDAWSRTGTLEMDTGLRLPLGMSLQAHYNDKLERRSGSSQTRLRVRQEERFPRLDLTWNRAHGIPYLKRVINSAQVTVNYTQTRHKEGEASLAARNLLTQGQEQEVRLVWSGRWRFGPSMTLERRYTLGRDRDYELLGAQDTTTARPPLRGSSSEEKTESTLTVRHKLQPRSLPLFGKLKSDVDLELKVGLESELRESATGEAARAPINANDKWNGELRASYRFSDNFRGEGTMRVEDNHNRLTDKTRKIREVRLQGTFLLQ